MGRARRPRAPGEGGGEDRGGHARAHHTRNTAAEPPKPAGWFWPKWAAGGSPKGLPYVADPAPKKPHDTFIFMINGAKVRAPAAAQALISRL